MRKYIYFVVAILNVLFLVYFYSCFIWIKFILASELA